MATKTIGIKTEVYERLAAEKREDESFTDTIDRLLEAATADWRHGFGRYGEAESDDLEQFVTTVQREHAEGFARRQDEVLEALDVTEKGDSVQETPANEDG